MHSHSSIIHYPYFEKYLQISNEIMKNQGDKKNKQVQVQEKQQKAKKLTQS